MNVSTNVTTTANVAYQLARRKNISQFMIFGDDQQLMLNISNAIIAKGMWKKNAVLISKYDEAMDIYIASKICNTVLMTALTSTFGWWIAFFSPDQNSVFYVNDTRPQADKVPSKELFLRSWQEYRE
ncbi:hypothetical protein RB195_007700 [Necator americanus]